MSHKDFLDDMYQEYLQDENDWVSKKYVVKSAFKKYYDNYEAHFELLRLIVYNLDAGKYNKRYLNFLESLLFTLLEENAISLIYKEKENRSIYFNPGLKKILSKHKEIFLDNELLTLSNTHIVLFIRKLQKKQHEEKDEEDEEKEKKQSQRQYKKRAQRKTKRKRKRKRKRKIQ